MKLIIDIPEELLGEIDDENYQSIISWYDTSLYYAFKNGTPIPDNATVCDIDAIRADIEAARYGLINDGLDVALRIIDKHCPSCGAKMVEPKKSEVRDDNNKNV